MKDLISKHTNSRREFLEKSAIAIAGLGALGMPIYANPSLVEGSYLRIIAYNVLKCTGWPKENVANKERIPLLMAEELKKYAPDIVNFSESPDEATVKSIAKSLDMAYVFFPSGGNWPGAILTRYRIVDTINVPVVGGTRAEDLFTRHWGKATLELSNKETVDVHSVHLYPHANPVSAEIRKREITEILRSMDADNDNGDRSTIVMGDLNHTPDSPEYSQWMDAGFTDSFAKSGKGHGHTIPVDVPKKRIDYVLARGPLANQIVESRALFERRFRTEPSEPDSFALSDHLPQFAEFKL
ncbi:MAG: endonuclease/exonuclease/phosphatase family protein [Flavobacteriaceae bacterium]|nr:endonuclease/exonuclease/phosphatase family protein [Flavobacteriaceae bacterium]